VTSLGTRKSLEPYLYDTVTYYQHQIDGIRELSKHKSYLLADDMGLGKSLQALTTFVIDVKRGWAQKLLIVCPVTLKGNWADEIEKFTRIKSVTLQGTPAQRRKQLADFKAIPDARILIVNYEQVALHYSDLRAERFDMVIYDEAHYLKNPKAKRTKACIDLYSNRKLMLTGTPMLNNVHEFWTILHMIDPDRFPKHWKFVQRYCVFGGYKGKEIVGVKNDKELKAILQAVMLRRLKKDVLDLPEVQIIERRVDLHPEQRKLYDMAAEEMILPLADEADPKEISNALVKFNYLKQICGTTLPFNGEDISSKLDQAVEDDTELIQNSNKIVVFTQFRKVQEAYVNRMRKLDVPVWQLNGDVKQPDRQPIVREWTATKDVGVICCMIQVAKEGLNLVAARDGSFLDELFVPGLNRQAIDRLHRIGQDVTQPVRIRKYIARGTIENRIQQILRTKSALFEDIVEEDVNFKKLLYKALTSKD
jgi:SNF2 family DNA or RNA helicase